MLTIKINPATEKTGFPDNRHDAGNNNIWDRTIKANNKRNGEFAFSNGIRTFKGRQVIDRNSRIAGGIYLGGSKREALVVEWNPKHLSDPRQSPLNKLYYQVLANFQNRKFDKSEALNYVFELAKKTFSNNRPEQVDNFIKNMTIKPDEKVPIDLFIEAKTGECRHMALTSAAILERLCDEGYLNGQARIHRNSGSEGAHAWVRYTTSSGEPIIIDSSNNFIGYLSESKKSGWDYYCPGEK